MKISTLAVIAIGSVSSVALASYEQPQPAAAVYYGKEQNAAYYGQQPPAYAPYPIENHYPQGYGGHYEAFEPVEYPVPAVPNAHVKYQGEEKVSLNLPQLGEYHCFLKGAPWTSCGRRSLQSYFLDQCMVFFFAMTQNVDGLCGVKPEEAEVTYGWEFAYPEQQQGDYYDGNRQTLENDGYAAPYDQYYQAPANHYQAPANHYQAPANYYQAPEAVVPEYVETPAPGAPVYGDSSYDYQEERCLQAAHIDITTALVMCLTENIIRIKYINHYAEDAAKNPIEGPTLYLNKMHQFIANVIECHPDHDFPNLYLEFKQDGRTHYNPNSPYTLDSANNVVLPNNMDTEASGLAQFVINENFVCNNIEDLGAPAAQPFIYHKDRSDPHYDPAIYPGCGARSAEYLDVHVVNTVSIHRAIKVCEYVEDPTGQYYGGMGPGKFMSPRTLRGLYDAVNTVTKKRMANSRPRSIAELALSHSGVHEQPLLEGNGIMYYCAFYACKANTAGNMDGTCFPKFDCESDWTIPAGPSLEDFNEEGAKIEACLAHKWIIQEDIQQNGKVATFFEHLHNRDYLCMAERRVSDFFIELYGDFLQLNKDEAWDLVYFRHLATESCQTEYGVTCKTDEEMYGYLWEALTNVVAECEGNRDSYYSSKDAYESKLNAYRQNLRPVYYPGAQSGYGSPLSL